MLSISNLEFSYGSKSDAFSLSIEHLQFVAGQITCILGRNGSGKTTLLSLIGGHLNPKSGIIELSGNDISGLPANLRSTATVFQKLGLFPHFTVIENIKTAIEPNTLFRYSADTLLRCKLI